MSSNEEITTHLEIPDSEEEIRRIMTQILQPRTHPTEQFEAFPDLESALVFIRRELETADQARANEPPTQRNEIPTMTDSIVVTTERVPPEMGSIVPYVPPAMFEFDVNHTAVAELNLLLGVVEPCQIALPGCQNEARFPTHQLGECSSEPAQSNGIPWYYPVTQEDLDEFDAEEVYFWDTMVLEGFEIRQQSELDDFVASLLADYSSEDTPIHAEPDATEKAIYLPHQSTETSQLEASESEFYDFIDSLMANMHMHTPNGESPQDRALPECQNLSASPTHQHDESNTQPALESPDIAMKFAESNPVNQQDLQVHHHLFFNITAPASPDIIESPVAHSPNSRYLTDVEENAFQESPDPPHQSTATSQSQPSNI